MHQDSSRIYLGTGNRIPFPRLASLFFIPSSLKILVFAEYPSLSNPLPLNICRQLGALVWKPPVEKLVSMPLIIQCKSTLQVSLLHNNRNPEYLISLYNGKLTSIQHEGYLRSQWVGQVYHIRLSERRGKVLWKSVRLPLSSPGGICNIKRS
jgi:hypothetical protein